MTAEVVPKIDESELPPAPVRVVEASDLVGAEPSEPALVVEGMTKSYRGGAVPVLKGVDLRVGVGERLAVIGANGSGKSTMLRCCMRLIDPDGGRVFHGETDFTSLRGGALRRARARVGFVFQKHNLQGRLSVLSNVVHGALSRGYRLRAWRAALAPKSEREFAMHCLDRVGLADLAERPARELSGGQSQRVAIARALMQKPSMLFADEPAASLDPAAGEEVMGLFSELCLDSGLTLVVVSHDMVHARQFADRIVGLRQGNMAFDAPAERVDPTQLREFFDD
jgi:phosphonate transport system ATP-binding protein